MMMDILKKHISPDVSPLDAGIADMLLEEVRLLFESEKTIYGAQLVHWLCHLGSVDFLIKLTPEGASPEFFNCLTADGVMYPLLIACDGGHDVLVEYLLEDVKVNYYHPNWSQLKKEPHSHPCPTPLQMACMRGHYDVVRVLITHINAVNRAGRRSGGGTYIDLNEDIAAIGSPLSLVGGIGPELALLTANEIIMSGGRLSVGEKGEYEDQVVVPWGSTDMGAKYWKRTGDRSFKPKPSEYSKTYQTIMKRCVAAARGVSADAAVVPTKLHPDILARMEKKKTTVDTSQGRRLLLQLLSAVRPKLFGPPDRSPSGSEMKGVGFLTRLETLLESDKEASGLAEECAESKANLEKLRSELQQATYRYRRTPQSEEANRQMEEYKVSTTKASRTYVFRLDALLLKCNDKVLHLMPSSLAKLQQNVEERGMSLGGGGGGAGGK
eukprot:CAMPEP_0113917826 /NCGR_PEP_ID=MMETSP0780_2-20120614/32962_1 /TAXON_ID=652834 /ORGANISM="Palpitomonas bilix" /LENGTH=438 /DNA_ID=CAMNT_0000917467 /DNA_START=1 /DNA_END=1317 /DNA_ORIENTATION=- /assembly_acc=CAM_ASM_000599